jgi:serine/threonine protein phosphatase PrpC
MSLANSIRARAVTTFMSKGPCPAQEDHVLVDRDRGIFVVADGFGGPIPGAAAAKTACEAVRSFLFKEAGDLEATLPFELRTYFSLAGNVLFNSLIHANRKIAALNQGKDVHEKGGASVLAGFIDGDLLAIANVGVCSAWLVRNGQAVELVMPRSFGRLCDPFAQEKSTDWQIPLIALGMSSDLEPEIFEYKIKVGDWLIISSDGVGPEVQDRLRGLQNLGDDPQKSIKKATEILNQGKYQDNASISLVIL